MGKKKKNKNKNKKNNNKTIKKMVNKVDVSKKEEPKEVFTKYYILIGFIIFVIFGFIYGYKVVNPGETTWIFTSPYGDILQHYVGWESFRVGDWTFPLGLTNATSYPANISVIYTDSIPIVALFFKLISFMLPKTFQYLGLYGLLCFILQGILSAKIVKKFTKSKLIIIVVSILFAIIPSMIFRMFYHTALASQWLLLLSLETIFLYSDFKDGKKIYYIWALIAFLCSTIHIYYLLMCGIILIGYILFDILNTKKIKKSIILLGIYLLVSAISIWIFGGFTNMTEGDSYGLGLFSYNLNGLINSQGWSVFLDKLPMIDEQYEGFSYLGLGVIILIIIAIIIIIRWFIKDKDSLKEYKNLAISLLVICIISIIFALSPKAYLGTHLLYNLHLPTFINDLWGIFRSTGRFVWPVIHILTLLSVIIMIKRLNWKYALLIISICTFIQVIDIGDVLSTINKQYTQDVKLKNEYNPYKYKVFKKVANNKKIKTFVFVSDDFYDTDVMIFSDWALNNNLKTNKFHFARTSFDKLLDKNTKKLVNDKDKSKVYLYASEDECNISGLKCYELPNDYYLGYVQLLN